MSEPGYLTGPLVDHHCHGVATVDLDRTGFEGMLNEAAGPGALGTTLFDSMLGLAIRRWCAPVLDLDPFVEAADYLGRRATLGAHEVNRRFLDAAGVSDYLVDTGLAGITDHRQTAAYTGGSGFEVVRLEALGERLLAEGVRGGEFAERLRERLSAADAVAAKSVAAYRMGLALPGEQPSAAELHAALDLIRPDARGRVRIAHPVVNAWLAHEAIQAGLPLQIHVGYGDSDLDLADCDPLALTGFLRATAERQVPVMLLHNYPFHRNAAYLAQVFGHVFVDVGLATHNTGALSGPLVRETLELVPFAKMLYSSDAYGLGEYYFLGSLLFRRALSDVLGGLVDTGEASASDAVRVADLIGRDNARRVYGLP